MYRAVLYQFARACVSEQVPRGTVLCKLCCQHLVHPATLTFSQSERCRCICLHLSLCLLSQAGGRQPLDKLRECRIGVHKLECLEDRGSVA